MAQGTGTAHTRTSHKRTAAAAGTKAQKRTRRTESLGEVRYFDYALLFLVVFLVAFGLIMLYSTSSYIAQTKFGDAAYYVKNQLRSSLVGFVLMIIGMFFPYRWWKKLVIPIYLLALGLNILVVVSGNTYGGSTRWLSIGGFSFQPSEASKVAMIVVVAALIAKAPEALKKNWNLFKIILAVLPVFALIAYSNLSTGIIILGIVFIMLFVAHPRYKEFVGLIVLGAAGIAVFLVTASYRLTRIQVWLHPEDYPDNAYQTLQGLYAIGSGGLFGKGLGNSIQKLVVPEPENDMIFTIICEELGLIGGICVIMLFVLMCWRFLVIANNAQDLFGSMLVIGVMAHIAIQTILNIAVVTNSIPNTGVVLPFISYGGTSVCFLLAEIGIVLSVSRGIRIREPRTSTQLQNGKEQKS